MKPECHIKRDNTFSFYVANITKEYGVLSSLVVESFADLLEENITFEERSLFPYLHRHIIGDSWNK